MVGFSFESLFIICSLVVAICVVIESTLLERNEGKLLLEHKFFMIISLLTSVWSFASCIAWYFLQFEGLGMSVVAAYPIYALLGLFYSMKIMKGVNVDDPAEVVLPRQYLSFCKSFGLVYALLCMAALVQKIGLMF